LIYWQFIDQHSNIGHLLIDKIYALNLLSEKVRSDWLSQTDWSVWLIIKYRSILIYLVIWSKVRVKQNELWLIDHSKCIDKYWFIGNLLIKIMHQIYSKGQKRLISWVKLIDPCGPINTDLLPIYLFYFIHQIYCVETVDRSWWLFEVLIKIYLLTIYWSTFKYWQFIDWQNFALNLLSDKVRSDWSVWLVINKVLINIDLLIKNLCIKLIEWKSPKWLGQTDWSVTVIDYSKCID